MEKKEKIQNCASTLLRKRSQIFTTVLRYFCGKISDMSERRAGKAWMWGCDRGGYWPWKLKNEGGVRLAQIFAASGEHMSLQCDRVINSKGIPLRIWDAGLTPFQRWIILDWFRGTGMYANVTWRHVRHYCKNMVGLVPANWVGLTLPLRK